MKILFVEDELSKNIPRIIRLFEKFLGKKRIKRLQDLDADVSGYGADPDEIKEIVEETNVIDVDYRFPAALTKVLNEYDRYLLFIIDRNLSESDYSFEEVNNIDSSFSSAKYEKFYEREGDYFFYTLFKRVDLEKKFFFLTAYDKGDEIRGIEEIEEAVSFCGDFKTQNVIEKGSDDFDRLVSIVKNSSHLNIQNENSHYLNLLRKHGDQTTADIFLDILLEKDDKRRIKDNLARIRNLYEVILRGCLKSIPDMEIKCKNEREVAVLGMSTITWLFDNGHSNSVIRNFQASIWFISSDFGSHENSTARKIYAPSTDTINALIYALKDIICWFGSIHSQNQR